MPRTPNTEKDEKFKKLCKEAFISQSALEWMTSPLIKYVTIIVGTSGMGTCN